MAKSESRRPASIKMKYWVIISMVGVVLISALAAFVYFTPKPRSMRQVTSYYRAQPDEATCAALLPQCGICPDGGEVIADKCYVPDTDAYEHWR